MAERVERLTIGGLDCVSICFPAPAGKCRAAVVLCHGFGAPGTDLVPVAGELAGLSTTGLAGTRFLFPAAPIELDPAWDARCWWPINFERMQSALATGDPDILAGFVPPELAACRELIHGLVAWCRDNDGLATDRVILGGFSQGAMLAADAALSLGQPLGGLWLWSGMTINRAVWRQQAATCPRLAIVQSHGTLDPVLPFLLGEQLRDLLTGAGHEVEFIRFAGQHQIPAAALRSAARMADRLCAGN